MRSHSTSDGICILSPMKVIVAICLTVLVESNGIESQSVIMQAKCNAIYLILELGLCMPHLSLQTLDGQTLVWKVF